jgi:hypothetical protein
MTTALLILWIAGMPLAWGLLVRNSQNPWATALIAITWPAFFLASVLVGLLGAFNEAPDEEEF